MKWEFRNTENEKKQKQNKADRVNNAQQWTQSIQFWVSRHTVEIN